MLVEILSLERGDAGVARYELDKGKSVNQQTPTNSPASPQMELGTQSIHPLDYQAAPSRGKIGIRAFSQLGMLLILAVLFIACSIFVDNFLSAQNLKGLLLAVSTVGMVSCTMLFCLASGNFDLSVGTIVPCAGVIAALITSKTGSYVMGLTAGLAVGTIVGLLNGVIVAICRINPLITTLAMMQIVKTATFKISEGKAIGVANTAFFARDNLHSWASRHPSGSALPALSFLGFFWTARRLAETRSPLAAMKRPRVWPESPCRAPNHYLRHAGPDRCFCRHRSGRSNGQRPTQIFGRI